MSVQANALLDVSDLKGFLSIPTTETEYDSELETLINYISDLFDVYTKRTLRAADHTEYLDGKGDDTIYVTHYPLNEATSSVLLYIDIEGIFGSDTVVARTDFRVYPLIGKIVLINNVFPEWPQVAKVFYPGGFSTIPGDIRIGMKETCSFFRKRGKQGGIGVSAITQGQGGSITYMETDLPKTVQAILSRYIRK
jgi:hypothetical protein